MEQSKEKRKAKRRQVKSSKMDSPLDPNHTHFILVDDGTVDKYGGEIVLRAKLEGRISKKDKAQNGDGLLFFAPFSRSV